MPQGAQTILCLILSMQLKNMQRLARLPIPCGKNLENISVKVIKLMARGSFCVLLGLLSFACCRPGYIARPNGNQLYSVTRELPVDSSVLDLYHQYKQNIDSQMNVLVANALTEIKRGKPEGRLNNLSADAISDIAKEHNISFDFVHINYKTLRVPLPQGPIRAFKVFELMPFENTLVTVKLSGQDIYQLFQYIAALGGDPISGATFKIENGRAVDIKIAMQEFDMGKSYTVLTNDYFANGGDKASFYTKSIERKDTNLKQRDALFEYLNQQLKKGVVLDPKLDGRITSDKPIEDE